MSQVRIRRRMGDLIDLPAAAVESLASALCGPLLRPGQPHFEEARAVWNAMITRQPALIARCQGTADVVTALRFAREHDLLLSVKGGGHNIGGTAVCEGGLMLDLSPMKGIFIDPGRRRALVQPGVLWGELDREAQLHGLGVPGGIVSTTGVAGLTLGGGFGWLSRRFGLTCDSVRAATVVTADGTCLQVSEEQHPELLWALRGGGGNFGVVTGFEFEAYPVGPTVLAGMAFYPLARAPELFRFYRELTARASEDLGSALLLRRAPPVPFLPPALHGQPVVGLAVCHVGPLEQAKEELASLSTLGEPLGSAIGPKPFMAHQQMLDASQPHGRRYYWKSHYLREISPPVVEQLHDAANRLASPFSSVLLMHLGGAIRRAGTSTSAAAGHRDAEYELNIMASWTDAAADAGHIRWARECWQAVEPHTHGGVYVNFLTEDEDSSRTRNAYGATEYQRLAELKQRYDPSNVFRMNRNITP